MKKRQENERKILIRNQCEERSSLFLVSWKGKGAELNQRRSVMAAKQQNEKHDLRDRHQIEREKLKESIPSQFPSFKKWLSLENNPELSVLYRYSGQFVLFAADGNEKFTPLKSFDLRDYSPIFGKRGGVMYCKNGKNTADFIDYGKKIVVSPKLDEFAVLAALQLASQKWGGVQISGSEEYKRLCIRLAAKHNFKIVNPELKKEVEAVRESIGLSNKHKSRDTGWSR